MPYLRLLALLAVLSTAGDEWTVLVRDGRCLSGDFSREGNDVVVRTAGGAVRVPDNDVLIFFRDPVEAYSRTKAGLEEAKKMYEEARVLPETNPLRVEKLSIALDILKDARPILEQLEALKPDLPDDVPTVVQLMRLCRDAKGSQMMGQLTKPDIVELDHGDYRISALPPVKRTWVDSADLGEGQVGLLKGLRDRNPRVRAATVRKLMSPPAPHASSTVVGLFETETDADVLKAVNEFLDRMEIVLGPKELAWAHRESDPKRRRIAIDLLKRSGDQAACDALVTSIISIPPDDNATRARIASALRKMREFAPASFKEAFPKARAPRAQIELIKQAGMVRDARLVPLLVQALTTYPDLAAAALIRIGREAIPDCARNIHVGTPEQRKLCAAICRRITDTDGTTAASFEEWYVKNRKKSQAEEAAWWSQQEEKDFPVNPDEFKAFDQKLDRR